MSSSFLKSALKLSKPERILLAEELWESLARDQDAPELSDAQNAELDRRLARLQRTGPLGSSWSAVKTRLKKRVG